MPSRHGPGLGKVCSRSLYRCKPEGLSTSGCSTFPASNCHGGVPGSWFISQHHPPCRTQIRPCVCTSLHNHTPVPGLLSPLHHPKRVPPSPLW